MAFFLNSRSPQAEDVMCITQEVYKIRALCTTLVVNVILRSSIVFEAGFVTSSVTRLVNHFSKKFY